MDMTPEKLAFIKGQSVNESTPEVTKSPAASASNEKTIELETSSQETEAPKELRAKAGRRQMRSRSSQNGPEVSELLDQVLVPVTIRLQHRTAQALRRAHLEQRLKLARPDTQQEIVEEAISEWLSRSGFLD